jgi:hypothetical protein
MEAVKGSAPAGGRRLRKVAWPVGIVGAALIALGAGTAQASDEFEHAFKYEAGRIAAHYAYGIGGAVLGGLIYGPYGRPYGPPAGYGYGYGYGYPYPPVVHEHHHYHHKHHHRGHRHHGSCDAHHGGPAGYERYERWERGYEHAGYYDD